MVIKGNLHIVGPTYILIFKTLCLSYECKIMELVSLYYYNVRNNHLSSSPPPPHFLCVCLHISVFLNMVSLYILGKIQTENSHLQQLHVLYFSLHSTKIFHFCFSIAYMK